MLGKFKSHKKTVIGISLALVLVLAGGWLLAANMSSKAASSVTEGTAKLDTIAVSVENDGAITIDKAVLNFSQSGVLKTLNVKVGDTVQAGDILAELDTAKLVAQVDQAASTYSANLEKAKRLAQDGEEVVVKKRALEAANSALAAEQAIYNDVVAKYGAGSSQELSEVAKLKKAEADVASADAQLALTAASRADAQYAANASYASLQVARTAVYDTKITAPFSGIVTSINGVVGQPVVSNQSGTAGFMTIANPGSATLTSSFDEEDIAKIKLGQKIKADFTALGTSLDGQVVYVSPIAKTDQNGTATYEVRSSYDAKGQTILDGMTASIKFITKQADKAVVVPNKAVKLVDGKPTISYYDTNKIVSTKAVKTGFTDGKQVAITSGLAVGDKYLIIE